MSTNVSLESTRPTVYVIAGPNGAGKTTFAMSYLNEFAGCREFLNADLIAAGLSPFNPDSQAITAGRLMLGRIDEFANQRTTFAIETTLAGRGHAQRLRHLKNDFGYRIELIFMWLPTADLAAQRVANRVRQGGHNIPVPVIQRRFKLGIKNFAQHYAPIADCWAVLDGSWYPPRPAVLHEADRSVSFDDSAIEAIKKHTPGLLTKPATPQSNVPNRLFSRLESAANGATQTIVESARRIPTPILVWRDGETVLINSITERRIPDDAGENWMGQFGRANSTAEQTTPPNI